MGNSESYIHNYSLETISQKLKLCSNDELKKEIYAFIPEEGTHRITNNKISFSKSLAVTYVMKPLFGTENNIKTQLKIFGPSPSVIVKLSPYQNKIFESCSQIPNK